MRLQLGYQREGYGQWAIGCWLFAYKYPKNMRLAQDIRVGNGQKLPGCPEVFHGRVDERICFSARLWVGAELSHLAITNSEISSMVFEENADRRRYNGEQAK
jgi:hypothetical protein